MNFDDAPKYIDPLKDFAFKKIFGTNKQLLIAFLNSVFDGRKVITEIKYAQTEHSGKAERERLAIFDLNCKGINDEHFIVEMQRVKQKNFLKRALFYTSRIISQEAPKDNKSHWNFDLREVYLIAVLEDDMPTEAPSDRYLNDIRLCNRFTKEISYEGFGIIYIELRKFTKTEVELETDLDRWLYILKNLKTMTEVPFSLQLPVFEDLFIIAEYSNLTKEEKMFCDAELKIKWDNDYVINSTYENGEEAGVIKGKLQGAQESTHSVILEMKKENMPVELIARITKLSFDEIENITV